MAPSPSSLSRDESNNVFPRFHRAYVRTGFLSHLHSVSARKGNSSSSTTFFFLASSLSEDERHQVFPSFHGEDVRRGLLSHLHHVFARKKIPMFKDQEIRKGHTIGSELVQAIIEARASIVVLSKNYASSIWCLDELVEILKRKQASGQIVIPIFYDVDPSDVRKQKGDFGIAFKKTCEGETEERKLRWIEALTCVATIAGEHSRNWTGEADMVENISTDVLNKLIEEEIKRQFRNCDIEQNGYITEPGLRYALTKDENGRVTDEEISDFFRQADVDGDGRISYDEFFNIVNYMIKAAEEPAMVKEYTTNVRLSSPERKEMIELFMAFDSDQDGFLAAAEFQCMMKKYGFQITCEQVSVIIRKIDLDGDGLIGFDDFAKWITEKTPAERIRVLFSDVVNNVCVFVDIIYDLLERNAMIKRLMSLDVDQNCYITAQENQSRMKKSGQKVNDEEASDFIRDCDLDDDGQSYDESVEEQEFNEITETIEKIVTDVLDNGEEFVDDILEGLNELVDFGFGIFD